MEVPCDTRLLQLSTYLSKCEWVINKTVALVLMDSIAGLEPVGLGSSPRCDLLFFSFREIINFAKINTVIA